MEGSDFFEKIIVTRYTDGQTGKETPIHYMNPGNLLIVGDRIIPVGYVSFLHSTERGLIAGEARIMIPCACGHVVNHPSRIGGFCFSCQLPLCTSCLRTCIFENKLCCPNCSVVIEDEHGKITVSKAARDKIVLWRARAKKAAAKRRQSLAERLLNQNLLKKDE